jgi:alpha-tubulin suppressor-like RCC1 family protein
MRATHQNWRPIVFWVLAFTAWLLAPPKAGAAGTAQGWLAAWGNNSMGQLGGPGVAGSPAPHALLTTAHEGVAAYAIAVAAGSYHSLALRSDGTVWAWGANWAGQLGDGSVQNRDRADLVQGVEGEPFLTHVVALAAGRAHSLALRSDGTVWAWGENQLGQLGIAQGTNSLRPVKVKELPKKAGLLNGVVAIAAGADHSLALTADGQVWAWGSNTWGQLGDGTDKPSKKPILVQAGKREAFGRVKAIAAGYSHSLALRADGRVWAWGNNTFGKLGDGTQVDRHFPVQAGGSPGAAPLINVIAISGGGEHSLALLADGTLLAWGWNRFGQLGDGSGVDRLVPVPVRRSPASSLRLRGVKEIAAGTFHSLALLADGSVRAWGDNTIGQLGDGTTTQRNGPVMLAATSNAALGPETQAIAAGRDHSLCLFHSSRIHAWGDNGSGQLGNELAPQFHPVAVMIDPALLDPIAASAGLAHSLALHIRGTVWAWGENQDGQLGDGSTVTRAEPAVVAGVTGARSELDGVKAIAAGVRHSLALRADGIAWAWGYNNSGQLGNGNTNPSNGQPTPFRAPDGDPLPNIIAVAGGYGHSLALMADGTVRASGENGSGELGDGTTQDRYYPVSVLTEPRAPLTEVIAIAAGSEFSLALLVDGSVWAWGNNNWGQLGDGTKVNRRYAVPVLGPKPDGLLTGVKAIAAGNAHSLAVGSHGTAWAWGQNGSGQLGDDSTIDRSTPVQVSIPGAALILENVKAVAAGGVHSLAILGDGTAWAWGTNTLGQVGDGTFEQRLTPVAVRDENNQPFAFVTAVAAGYQHSLALQEPDFSPPSATRTESRRASATASCMDIRRPSIHAAAKEAPSRRSRRAASRSSPSRRGASAASVEPRASESVWTAP